MGRECSQLINDSYHCAIVALTGLFVEADFFARRVTRVGVLNVVNVDG